MGERDDARRSIAQSRERMSEIAEELSRRASPDYVRGRAKEVAVRKMSDVRQNPRALGVVGALLGGSIGAALGRRAQDRRWESEYRSGGFTTGGTYVSRDYMTSPTYPGYMSTGPSYVASPEVSTVGSEGWTSETSYRGFEGREEEGPGLKEKASAKAGQIKERAAHLRENLGERTGHLRESASGRIHNVRERMPSRTEVRGKATEMVHSAEDRPLGLALGAFALGAAAAILLPISSRERRVMHPAKERVRSELGERVESFESRIEERLGAEQPSVGGEMGPIRAGATDVGEATRGFQAPPDEPWNTLH